MTLGWHAPGREGGIAEYEVHVHPLPSGSTAGGAAFAITNVHTLEYTVVNLESSTDYTFQVRARGTSGWGALTEAVVARTDPPPRILPAPEAPIWDELGLHSSEKPTECSMIGLRVPTLRRGCTRDTALSLEYREAGGAEWRQYESSWDSSPNSVLISLPKDHSRDSVEFRLRAHRGPLVSEPSEVLGPIETCIPGPVRSLQTVTIALAVAAAVCALAAVAVCRASNKEGFSKEKPPKREPGMTRLKTTDDDEVGIDRDELAVHYQLNDGGTIDGMLPLGGIMTSAELLDELAEFGCELQDEVFLNIHHMDVQYEDRRGKVKTVGPRTPLDEIIEAGDVTVIDRSRPPPRRNIGRASCNGSGAMRLRVD